MSAAERPAERGPERGPEREPERYVDDCSTVYFTDVFAGAELLAPESIHTIVTSPPYWNLRSYLPADHPLKDREIGAEPTPEAYVEKIVEVFRALRPALRSEGSLWLNLGDGYAGSWGNQGQRRNGDRGSQRPITRPSFQKFDAYPETTSKTGSWVNNHPEIKGKDLLGLERTHPTGRRFDRDVPVLDERGSQRGHDAGLYGRGSAAKP